MPEKISITRKEIEELYDITDDEPKEEKKEESTANATFEEFTERYDKNQIAVEEEDG